MPREPIVCQSWLLSPARLPQTWLQSVAVPLGLSRWSPSHALPRQTPWLSLASRQSRQLAPAASRRPLCTPCSMRRRISNASAHLLAAADSSCSWIRAGMAARLCQAQAEPTRRSQGLWHASASKTHLVLSVRPQPVNTSTREWSTRMRSVTLFPKVSTLPPMRRMAAA